MVLVMVVVVVLVVATVSLGVLLPTATRISRRHRRRPPGRVDPLGAPEAGVLLPGKVCVHAVRFCIPNTLLFPAEARSSSESFPSTIDSGNQQCIVGSRGVEQRLSLIGSRVALCQ